MRFFVIFAIFSLLLTFSWAGEYQFNPDPQSYVIEKIESHDIIFLGTTHKRSQILNFISSLIPKLHKVGVSHLCLEIDSDQQHKVDHYIQTGEGLYDIEIWPPIDCPEYRRLLTIIRDLPANERPSPVCIDLPKTRHGKEINRDEWMAMSISKIFHNNPGAKVFVKIGSLHTLKKLDWQDHVPNKRVSIREELTRLLPNARVFSIVNVIDQKPDKCDFTRQFDLITAAVDCDERFLGWKAGFLSVIAIKPAEVCTLVDGLIIY